MISNVVMHIQTNYMNIYTYIRIYMNIYTNKMCIYMNIYTNKMCVYMEKYVYIYMHGSWPLLILSTHEKKPSNLRVISNEDIHIQIKDVYIHTYVYIGMAHGRC